MLPGVLHLTLSTSELYLCLSDCCCCCFVIFYHCSWITDTYELSKLAKYAEDKAFQKKWIAVKQENKAKLAAVIKETFGDDVPLNALFDIQVGCFSCLLFEAL
jgi:glucan phosphorylase